MAKSKSPKTKKKSKAQNEEAFGQTREERWLKKFESATPKDRFSLTLDMLKQTPLIIRGDDLLYVVSALNEVLLYFNRSEDLATLAKAIEDASKKEAKNVQVIFDIASLNVALYENSIDQVKSVLDSWEGVNRDFMGPLALTLESVFHYGYRTEAEVSAGYFYHSLKQRMHQHEEMRYQCGDYCISALLQSMSEGSLPAQVFEEAMVDLEVPADEVPRIISNIGLSAEEHIKAFKSQLNELPDHLLSHLQFPFSEYMASKDMSFYTSGEIMTTCFSFWFYDEENTPSSIEEMCKLNIDSLKDFLSFVKEAYPDTHLPYLLLWGMPLIFDWLRHTGTLESAQFEENIKVLKAAQIEFLETETSWTFSYILNWPLVQSQTLDSEKEHFEKVYNTVQDLPDNVEANQQFETTLSPLHPEDQKALLEELILVKAQYGDEALQGYAKDLKKELGKEITDYLLNLVEESQE